MNNDGLETFMSKGNLKAQVDKKGNLYLNGEKVLTKLALGK